MKRIVFLFFAVLNTMPLFPQEWEINLEDYYEFSWINNSMMNKDGDILFVGCVSDVATDRNCCIAKVSQDGDFDIHVFTNDTLYTALTDMVQLPNGNYFAQGICSCDGSSTLCPFIMLFDEDLNKLKECYIDVCGDTYLKCEEGPMVMDDDGNIIITCDVMISTTGSVNKWGCVLIKFSSEGEELKRNYIVNNAALKGLSAVNMLNVPNSDEILVLGNYMSNKGLVFFDSDLNFLRGCNVTLENAITWRYYSNIFVDDDRLILYQDVQDILPNYPYLGDTIYARIGMIDFQGELIDCTDFKPKKGVRFMADGVNRAMSAIDESHFYVMANEEYWTCGPKDTHLYLMDYNLNVLGEKILQNIGANDFPVSIIHTRDGGCMLAIDYSSISSHILKFPVTDFDPTWSVEENEIADITSEVYPNPATNTLHFNSDEAFTLSIMDIQGRKLLQKNVSEGDNEIDISNLNSGMYIYEINGNNFGNKIGKFIKK